VEETISADVIHMRIDGGDSRRHGHHRLQRIAAFCQQTPSDFSHSVMRGGSDAAAMSGGVESHLSSDIGV